MIELFKLLLSIYFIVGILVSLKAGIKDTLWTRQPLLCAVFYILLGPVLWLPIAIVRTNGHHDDRPAF